MVVLDRHVRLVALQFSFSNHLAIPAWMKRPNRETQKGRVVRKSRTTGGTLVIEPTEKCSIAEFLGDLEVAGYGLVDYFYEVRIDARDPRGERTYYMARFLFARHEFVELSDEFKGMRDTIRAVLSEICRAATWRARAFSNPFYKNGEEVAGQCAVSINFEARQPFFRSDGQLVVVWQKNERGNRVGDAPLPLKPDYCLRVVDGVIQLVAA